MSTFAAVADLPLTIEGYELERLERAVSSAFTRVTTQIRLRGGGDEGIGEDVTYSGVDHDRLRDSDVLSLEGRWTFASFSDHMDSQSLFAEPPEMAAFLDYRRWAFESGALDLALRQAGTSLADAVGRQPAPVRFVVSMRLGEPSSIEPLRRVLGSYPSTRFKLDPVGDWTPDLVGEIANLGVVDAVDLKGAYKGTVVDNPPDARLYRLVAEGFPRAWIEDPALNPETDEVLRPHRDRITWDAPIHSVADVDALPFPPKMLNIKPSRFGTVRRLFEAYDYCSERGIGMYGGGQFELGVGRGQIQYLASLFHPDAPNDVAPGGYNLAPPDAGLPASPLDPAADRTGFRWG